MLIIEYGKHIDHEQYPHNGMDNVQVKSTGQVDGDGGIEMDWDGLPSCFPVKELG
ncbi:hypothetical protein HQN88_21435 [Paenibacillus qinlingensis]|nr:hypothetical protein [Paenibacillus qinlingensis]